jgi:hypothetical protein
MTASGIRKYLNGSVGDLGRPAAQAALLFSFGSKVHII